MGQAEDREFLQAVSADSGFWEHESSEEAFLDARRELRGLGMAEDRIAPFLAGLYEAGKAEAYEWDLDLDR